MNNCHPRFVVFVAWLVVVSVASAADPVTGPQTEARFPPLVVPAGFKATLFACDPLVEYPSVIALGPKQGTVFVAHDYVTGLGYEIVRRDEIRLLADSDGDGYADQSTLYADGFNSIQGLAYHAGTVYAMHAPLLTALRDTDGDGKADERRDLLKGLGLTPEDNQTRLHCANGVVVGHDGWLYLAMGDNGTNVLRPEGDRLVLNGGGILRCRYDGRDLHVFSTGLRNIYDIALDEELNVFVRDNENDGGDYMIRVAHSFFGADHGYPYLYYERPKEALAPLADLGRGSSAGMVCYLETAFPPEYRGNLFCCEWGKSIVRYERKRQGSSFAPMKEIEFATGAPGDPYGFKPTDLIVDYDGSLLVSDWCDGQRPKRGRGRIYRIAYAGEGPASRREPWSDEKPDFAALLTQLDSPSHHARFAAQDTLRQSGPAGQRALEGALIVNKLGDLGRMHAAWIIAPRGQRQEQLARLIETDPEPRVRVQAIRALTDETDPRFGGATQREMLLEASLALLSNRRATEQDPRILLESIIALGREGSNQMPYHFRRHISTFDVVQSHAFVQLVRRSDSWSQMLPLLDEETPPTVRKLALMVLADRVSATIVDDVVQRMQDANQPDHQREYADLLTRVYKKPGEWKYWGYRPAPRPANTVAWERTDAIEQALDRALNELDPRVRLFILQRMQREQIPVRRVTLERWLKTERTPEALTAILASLARISVDESRLLLAAIIEGRDFTADNRRAALKPFIAGLSAANERQLLELATRIEDGPVLVDLLSELSQRPALDSRALVLSKLDSESPAVRAAALNACAALSVRDASSRVTAFLSDADAGVRRAAAIAAGALSVKDAASALLSRTGDSDPAFRSASLDALRRLREPGANSAAVAALNDAATQLAAIEYLAEFGTPEHTAAITAAANSNRASEILSAVVRALSNWESREAMDSARRTELQTAIAEVHGQSGVLLRWQVVGPLTSDAARPLREMTSTLPSNLRTLIASDPDARVEWESPADNAAGAVWCAFANFAVTAPTKAQFLGASNSPVTVWLNGRSVHQREKAGALQSDAERFTAELTPGVNRIVLELGTVSGKQQFQWRFRPLSSSAEHERLTQYALQNTGNADRGRELFLNAEKTLCAKCHRLGEQGGNIGPILTGVGSRFSRIHLVESILEPSRTIAPSYDTISAALANGRVVTGVKISEDATTLVLGDETGKRHEIAKTEIEERVPQRRSTMPEGLEKRFTDREFLDLLAFLLAEKK